MSTNTVTLAYTSISCIKSILFKLSNALTNIVIKGCYKLQQSTPLCLWVFGKNSKKYNSTTNCLRTPISDYVQTKIVKAIYKCLQKGSSEPQTLHAINATRSFARNAALGSILANAAIASYKFFMILCITDNAQDARKS